MQSTGIVRNVDPLGRFVLPIELRRVLGIEVNDALEIYRDGDKVVLKKYEPCCIFCGSTAQIEQHKGKNLCRQCLDELKSK